MYFLILCILSSTGIFIIFKSIDRRTLPSLPVIVINYLTAALLGWLIQSYPMKPEILVRYDWYPLSMLIGVLFIAMFFLVAHSTSRAGISVTTVASKMSVIFPIVFSILIDPSDHLTLIKGIAIILTLAGVALTVYSPQDGKPRRAAIYLPLLLFAGMGLVDSLVKFAQHRYVGDTEVAMFSSLLFLNAFISGLLVVAFFPGIYRSFLRPAIWGWGILLGGVNFGSIFFLVRALNHITAAGSSAESSVIFGINNIGIVALSVMAGWLVFKESLRVVNWIGIALSAVALILFMAGS
jgi:drug/metabolite transporter (DMT)-like permease